jgi:hypothetical protein
MKISNINECKVNDIIGHKVCLGIQGSFLFLINDLIFHSSFNAFSIRRSIYDLINYVEKNPLQDENKIDTINEPVGSGKGSPKVLKGSQGGEPATGSE